MFAICACHVLELGEPGLTVSADDADVLIHECYFPDNLSEWAAKTGHSAATPVAQLAKAANVGRLLLVHVDPQRPDDDPVGMDAIRSIFPKTELAEDLMEIEF